ncbi:CPCC family cysteine-rich protein [Succinivibrio sp.]|uniref:CPCC family cysteine-rich protein n=1 Tax=Succinivibrio sp. TaxID=2053619 RepID=UPI0025E87695|nr:CPCC family cysteine-rich protein [Succinivibrio sp.]MBQ9221488.1 hypothetical protein [Succinivibrio sp.]
MDNLKEFKSMMCPVCGKLYFTKHNDPNVENILGYKCHFCGWKYDLDQTEDPNLKNGNNEMSLNEYREWYQEQLKKDPDFDFTESNYQPKAHICPVCGKHVFTSESSFEICPFCGWEDDALMEDEPDKWDGCSNDICLNKFRERYQKELKKNPNYKFKKDGLPDQ